MSVCAVDTNFPSWQEPDRLAVLRSYEILDTEREASFDGIAKIAAQICQATIARVSLVDEEREWFKSTIGLSVRETPLEQSICAHAIRRPGLFIVPDLMQDARFSSFPVVSGEPYLRFYAGAPLITKVGMPLGTLCILDTKPRSEGLTQEQVEALLTLAHSVARLIELRQANQTVATREKQWRAVAEAIPQMVWSTGPDGKNDYYSALLHR